jgi:SAM-dependent methyltransferase
MKNTICNICGNKDFLDWGTLADIKTGENFAASGFKSNGELLIECKKCGLVFIEEPIKGPKEILDEYSGALDKDYVSQIEFRIKTFKDSINHLRKIAWIHQNGGRILDVGAAAGAFVKAAKDDGWFSYGIEPCGYLVEWGNKNLNLSGKLMKGTIDNVEAGQFDVITFWDVLEHTTDPSHNIEEAVKRLASGGYIAVNVPDISSIIPKIMGMRWPFYESAHLYYFTGKTLDDLMRRHGLERVHYSQYWQGLSLGYLAYRFKQFNEPIAKLMTSVISTLGLSDIPMKYYIGQSLYVYKYVKRGK